MLPGASLRHIIPLNIIQDVITISFVWAKKNVFCAEYLHCNVCVFSKLLI